MWLKYILHLQNWKRSRLSEEKCAFSNAKERTTGIKGK